MIRRRFLGKMKTAFVMMAVVVWWVPTLVAAQSVSAARGSANTPRTPDGKPDLSGFWANTSDEGRAYKPDAQGNVNALSDSRPCQPGQECRPALNRERDSGVQQRVMGPNYNVPLYKPQYWEKVQDLDVNGNQHDLSARCYPAGVPRMGAPQKILQTANEVVLLYHSRNRFRVIPTDGRPHDPVRAQDVTWDGEPSGRWEGDTLVIESVGFTDESWLGWPGYFHTNNMRVIERVRREGDTLIWETTVHDPEVLLEPYKMTPIRRNLNTDPLARLTEDPPCDEQDWQHMATRERG